MKKSFIVLIVFVLFFALSSCGSKTNYVKADYEVKMTGKEFKIINFADLQIDKLEQFGDDGIPYLVVKEAIEAEKPDMITFSGDNAVGTLTLELYKLICDRLDVYEIPYFFVYGNHDRETLPANEIADVINSSKYGHIKAGYTEYCMFGNYTIDIVNSKGKPVHRILMMDSAVSWDKYEVDFGYADEAKTGRNNWYKSMIEGIPCESTIIMHIPFVDFLIVYDEYEKAQEANDEEKLKALAPIGPCRKKEGVNTSTLAGEFFPVILECGNTKNVIVGHDHSNDYSLVYQGVRLTYSVKTGNGCYFYDETMCGCTSLTIDDKGNTTTDQRYYYPSKAN